MNILPAIKDTRGKPSHTLFFIAVAFFAIVYKFVTGDGTDFGGFGTAIMLILGPYLGREWMEKNRRVDESN